jgi:hypothetical protein
MTAETPELAALAARLIESRQLQEPPEWATHRALGIWRPDPARQPAQAPALLRRVLAQWGLMPGESPLALGLRGVGTPPQQWLFHAEEHDIELRLRPDPQQPEDRWQLAGQVLGPQAAGQLQLAPAGGQGPVRQVALDELGDFHLDDLPAGRWGLSLTLPDRVIELPELAWPDGTAG